MERLRRKFDSEDDVIMRLTEVSFIILDPQNIRKCSVENSIETEATRPKFMQRSDRVGKCLVKNPVISLLSFYV